MFDGAIACPCCDPELGRRLNGIRALINTLSGILLWGASTNSSRALRTGADASFLGKDNRPDEGERVVKDLTGAVTVVFSGSLPMDNLQAA